jgi:hypothetical protein
MDPFVIIPKQIEELSLTAEDYKALSVEINQNLIYLIKAEKAQHILCRALLSIIFKIYSVKHLPGIQRVGQRFQQSLESSSVADRGPPCIVLRTNRKWVGASKWIVRALNQYDEKLAEKLVEAFDLFHRTGDKNKVFQLVDKALEPYGGQLFEGFSVGKSVNGFTGRGGAQ